MVINLVTRSAFGILQQRQIQIGRYEHPRALIVTRHHARNVDHLTQVFRPWPVYHRLNLQQLVALHPSHRTAVFSNLAHGPWIALERMDGLPHLLLRQNKENNNKKKMVAYPSSTEFQDVVGP